MKLVYDVGRVGWYSLSAQTQAQASYADTLTSQRLSLSRQTDTSSVPGHC